MELDGLYIIAAPCPAPLSVSLKPLRSLPLNLLTKLGLCDDRPPTHPAQGFLRNYSRGLPPPLSGANDAQANCVARLAPLAAAFAASHPSNLASAPETSDVFTGSGNGGGSDGGLPYQDPLLHCVELATRVTQNTVRALVGGDGGCDRSDRD